jgi:cytochrome c556
MRLIGRWAGTAVVLGVGLVVGAGGALAQSAGAKAAHDRHEGFEQLGKAFKAINDQLQSGKPDLAVVRASAQTVQAQAGKVGTWFPAGSGPQAGVKTHAKAQIWSDPAGFQAALKPLAPAAAKLNAAAKGGDVDAIRAAFKETGAACGGCHDKFREKKS